MAELPTTAVLLPVASEDESDAVSSSCSESSTGPFFRQDRIGEVCPFEEQEVLSKMFDATDGYYNSIPKDYKMHVWAEQGKGHMLHAVMRQDTGDMYKANDIPVWLTADLSLKRFLTVIECHYHWNKIDESFNVWHWMFFIGQHQWSLPSSTVEQMLIANDLSADAVHHGVLSLNITMIRRQHKIAKILKRFCLLPHRKYKADQMSWAPWLGHSEFDTIPHAGPGAIFDPWDEQISADLAQNAEIVAHLANYYRVNLQSLPTSIRCQRAFYDMAELTLETMLKLSEHTSLHDDVFVEIWLDKQQFLGHSKQSITDGTHIGPFITLLWRKPQIMTILSLPTSSDEIVRQHIPKSKNLCSACSGTKSYP